jgi:hypothetical protein
MKKIPMPVAVTVAVAAVALAGFMIYKSMGSAPTGGNAQSDITDITKDFKKTNTGEEVPLEMRNQGVGAGTRNDSQKDLKGTNH